MARRTERDAEARAESALLNAALAAWQPRPLAASSLADLLILAEPVLADIAHLEALLAPLASGERLAAELWARAKVATRGDASADAMPTCVAALFRRLEARLASNTKEID